MKVLWSRNERIIGEDSLTNSRDPRVNIYRTSSEYFLRIENVTADDAGEYKITVSGMGVDATYDMSGVSELNCARGELVGRHLFCLFTFGISRTQSFKSGCTKGDPHKQKFRKRLLFEKKKAVLAVLLVTCMDCDRSCDLRHCKPIQTAQKESTSRLLLMKGRSKMINGSIRKSHLRVTSDKVKPSSKGCPRNERMCRSGHCLPVSQFCDRIVQCPDGDDEQDCSSELYFLRIMQKDSTRMY
ncbi:unnamed protein product [Cylicostephanus goldi]|uniref:Uncharacterized protein n=1 Tax=Cylicostephanus goldi TaxID=71465 RepID=A0A3P6S7H9_CYLGO|nr:unnamed protein product [Cylicostephanus goldi]